MMKGQIAIITGASSGLGRSLAIRLVAHGAKVVLADLNLKALKELADDLNKEESSHGKDEDETPKAIFRKCDVTVKEEFVSVFEAAKKVYGGFTTLINNAGIVEIDSFSTNELDSWKKVVDVDLTAVILGTRLALSYIQSAGNKSQYSIVNVSSLAGIYPQALQPVYAAAKAGVVNFSRSLGYLKQDGIRVNVVCPSFVKTSLTSNLQTSEWVELGLVIDAFMIAIQDETLAGEVIRITPRYGIDIYRPGSSRKQSAKF